MPSYEPPSWQRHELPKCWAPVALNTPASGRSYRVTQDGKEFVAFYEGAGKWVHMTDGFIGGPLKSTVGLKFETSLTPSVRL